MRPGVRQAGAIAPAAAVAALLLAILALGAIGIGRLAATRSDVQRAADAAVLAAAELVRERGLPFDAAARNAAETIARHNSALPINFQWNITQSADTLDVDVRAVASVDLTTLVFNGGSQQVEARARGSLTQSRFDEAERRLPKLALVLDYSGSMALPFSGGGGQAIDVLESSVAGLLGADLMIDYGAVFYSTNVFRTVAVGPGAPNQIMNVMNSYGAGGSTNTGAAMNTARNLLTAADNTGYYVLLVSDGEPCCGGGAFNAARNAATNLWNSDVTIFTLEIRRSGSSAALAQLMTDVAGTPANRGDPNHHFVATSAADLVDQFRNIVSSIVCKAGPISPAPTDPASVRVYLAAGSNERAVPAVGDLAANAGIEAYRYETSDQTIRLTQTACDAVIDAGDDIIVRYDRPDLTQ
jgi:Flp pilus assembly protein TadG